MVKILQLAAVTALLVVIMGGATYDEEEAQLGEGIPPQTSGGTAEGSGTTIQTKGRTAYEDGLFAERTGRSLPGIRLSNLAEQSRTVPESVGSRKGSKPGAPGRMADRPKGNEASQAAGGASSVGSSVYRAYPGADYRGTFLITAYTAGYESTGKRPGDPAYGITASGTTVEEGRTIAADWDVLPKGTRVYIDGVGERVVEDRGGAVDGKHIDLYITELDEAKDWGKKKKKVYVLEWGGKDE